MQFKPFSFRKLIKNYQQLDNKVAIIPTDTVMGVVSKSAELIYQIKNRPTNKWLVLFVNNFNDVIGLFPHEIEVIDEYWPGALTIVKNKKAYRMPDSKNILKLLSKTGPLYSSSANISGKPPIKNAKNAFNEFQNNIINILVIKGKEYDDYPSTIIDLDNLVVLRRGRIDGQEVIEKLKKHSENQ